MELLRDPLWQFAGVILTLCTIAVTLLVYVWQRGRREIAFGVISCRTLLSIDDEVSGRVSVSLDGVSIRNLQLVVCGLKNSGTQPIRPADYERPITITFGDNAQILTLQTIREYPENIEISAESKGDRVAFAPVLMNPGDYAVIQILLSAETPRVRADCRISGVTGLVQLNKTSAFPHVTVKSYIITTFQVLVMFAITWPLFTIDYPPEASERFIQFWPWFLVFFAGIMLAHLAGSLVFNPRSRRIENP